MDPKPLAKLAWIILLIGGINWGLIGFFKYNLVEKIFSTGLSRIIYAIVGLAALYCLWGMWMMMAKTKTKAKK